METESPKVQVVCITYKHEQYLADALESFVRQKTNFPYEVLVGNDCSPDGTQAIIDEYVQKYPHIIRDIKRECNMGPTRNLIDLCSRCTAPYIAFCEGDDYWIDEFKLQKQFDFMEAHSNIRACYTSTRVLFPKEWGLESYYIPVNGEVVLPDSVPGYVKKATYKVHELVGLTAAQTSSFFFRWDYSIVLPEWYHGGMVGDWPLLFLQVGTSSVAFLPEITSVYRRSEVGCFMTRDKNEHFRRTRREHIRYLYGCFEYFREHHNSYACPQFLARLTTEVRNLLNACNAVGDYAPLISVLQDYPDAMKLALPEITGAAAPGSKKVKRRNWLKRTFIDKILFDKHFYLSEYKDVAKAGISARKHYFRQGWKEGRRPYPEKIKYFGNIKSWLWYWLGALVPKKKNLWVVSSFFMRGYLDNTKYLYEHIVQNHPEIDVVWLTSDRCVYEGLKQKGMPVKMMKKAKWTMLRASVAFTDHFKCSDYLNKWGLNARTKIVQLWHGVGLKNMVPVGDTIPNTSVPGVRLSSDIFPNATDGVWKRLKKKLAYIFKAPFRELPEEYFGFVCPGPAYAKFYGEGWHMPKGCCIFSGYPRNIHLHAAPVPDRVKVIYAPTYRWSPEAEDNLIQNFIKSLPLITDFLESYDGEMVLRLHPHTWRNYMGEIESALALHPRVTVDEEKDIYTRLGEFSHMIGDYSSISNDFAELMNRPHVFFVPDLDYFTSGDCSLNLPFEENSPGAQVTTWPEVVNALKEYIEHPKKDEEWRARVRDIFFDMKVNDANNSKRIVDEVKRRLKMPV